jgi:hypothetical protein
MATICSRLINPPEEINGIFITSENTGSVSNYTFGTYPFCFNNFNIPRSSSWVGKRGPFTYTLNFSAPVNNLQLIIAATGGKITSEEFLITTNGGIPTIILDGGCQNTIISNRIISGSEEGTQGGFYTISSPLPYTSLTIKGQGGGMGSLIGICADSIPDLLEELPSYITTTIRPTTTQRPTTPAPEFFAKLGNDIVGEFIGDESGTSISTNFAGDIIAIGAPFNNNSEGIRAGHTRIYSWNYETADWIQIGKDIDGDSGGDRSGYSVSLNSAGDKVSIGAPYDSTLFQKNGQVRVYQWNNLNDWEQLGQTIYGDGENIYSGIITMLNSTGDILAIVSDNTINNNNIVKTYKLIDNEWVHFGNNIEFENNIKSISLNEIGDIIAIGIPEISTVHTYYYDEYFRKWLKLDTIQGSSFNDNTGYSVSLNAAGDILAVGVPLKDYVIFRTRFFISTGGVQIYKWSTAYIKWIKIGQDITGDTYEDELGRSVSLNSKGDTVAIGSNVRIYNWNKESSTWIRRTLEDFNVENVYSDSVLLNYDGSRVFAGNTYILDENLSQIDSSNQGSVKVYQVPKFIPPTTTTTSSTTPDPSLIIPVTVGPTLNETISFYKECIPFPTLSPAIVAIPNSARFTTKKVPVPGRIQISPDATYPFSENVSEPIISIITTTTSTAAPTTTSTTKRPEINICIPSCNKLKY